MKQVIIRILGPQIPVYDVVFGRIKDGQFVSASVDEVADFFNFDGFGHFLVVSTLLGGQAFVTSDHLASLVKGLSQDADSVTFYPNFIVFGYGEKEETAEE